MNNFARFIALLTSCKSDDIQYIYYLKSLNVIKEMVSVQCATIELYMYLGGLLSSQEARVALGYRLVRLLRFARAKQTPASIHNAIVAHCTLTIS